VTPYYQDDLVTLYHGDAREIAPAIVGVDSVVSDPPYGIGWGVEGGPTRSKSRKVRGDTYEPIVGDGSPFDPEPWLQYRSVVLWGANHYASRLPPSPSWLVWDKRPSGWSNDQADCELAWTNLGGPARMFRMDWSGGGTLRKENGSHPVAGVIALHPSQKPLSLMRWVIAKVPDGTILDPFAGSGSTLVAAKSLGRRAIGIEIVERYAEAAARRCSQEVLGLSA
jgi:site-specific DNA-methyltransferase (adenine-specific)